ncbi:MAG: branched-chain amino acid ABC transporter permease [Actinomycetes bacterium]
MTAEPVNGVPLAQRLRGVRQNEDVRRLATCLLAGFMLAVITGPEGREGQPTYAITQALRPGRLTVCLLIGVALWGSLTAWSHYGETVQRQAAPRRERFRELSRLRPVRYGWYAALLAFAILFPLTLGGFWQEVLVDQIGIFALLAIGLNVVVGFAGLLDLGYIAFYAIGAYTTAYFTGTLPVQPPFVLNPFYAIPLAVAAAMLAGFVLGAPTLRLRGDYLAIVTLGFGEIVQISAVNLDSITNGSRGAFGIPPFSIHIGSLHYTWSLKNLPYYYLLLGFTVMILILFTLLENSRVGRAWTAIREDEVAAQACGIPTVKYKLMAFAIGASTSGFAGTLYASKITYFNPSNFALTLSILVLAMVVFGGMGSLWGSIAGAAVLAWFPQFLEKHPFVPPEDKFVYFGALLIIMMIFRPQGVIPSRRRAREIGLAEAGVGAADALGVTPGRLDS